MVTPLTVSVRLAILGLNAYLLYRWFKNDRRLDSLAWVVRISAVLAGTLLFLAALHISNYENQDRVLRYLTFPAAALLVIFLFLADASYFVACGLRKLLPSRKHECSTTLDPVDGLSNTIRAAAIGLGLMLCFSALYFGDLQNQVRLNRVLLLPGAGVACLFAFVPALSVALSQTLRNWFGGS